MILQISYLCLMQEQVNNPLHGKRLDTIIEYLVDYYGWDELGRRINIRCFNENPSVKSSLDFPAQDTLGSGKSRTALCENHSETISALCRRDKERLYKC